MARHETPLLLGMPPGEALVHCIFIHGRTQSPEDMQEQAIARLKTTGVAYILPRATGNSWYDARATDCLTDVTRRQLGDSVAHIRSLVAEAARSTRRQVPLVIAGFSQGACLAIEYAMQHGPWTGTMINFTGCRVGTTSCQRPFADLDCMPVYLTGSDKDSWISTDAFSAAAEALARARARLRCEIFPDRGHEISAPEIAAMDLILSDITRRERPIWP